jgi:hypothetical protein
MLRVGAVSIHSGITLPRPTRTPLRSVWRGPVPDQGPGRDAVVDHAVDHNGRERASFVPDILDPESMGLATTRGEAT